MTNPLIKIKENIDKYIEKAILTKGKVNVVLYRIERSKKFKEAYLQFYRAFTIQTTDFLRTEIFKQIARNDPHEGAEHIYTESDINHIRNEVYRTFKPLTGYLNKRELLSYYIFLANAGGQAFLDKMKKHQMTKAKSNADLKGVFVLEDPKFIGMLADDIDLLVDSVDSTTKTWIANQIIKGKTTGLSDFDIAEEIRKKIPETYKWRADRIVRTETANIVNKMEYETAVKNQATTKIWSAAGDNICQDCEGNDGEEVGMDSTFPSGDFQPPAHPNCKCLLQYVVPPFIDIDNAWSGEE